MSLYPDATLKLIPESYTQPAIRPRMSIVHSTAGYGELYGWWMNPASRGLESHFWISRTGWVVQYVDTEVRADANGEANGYAVSIETESSPSATERWTIEQAEALTRLLRWLSAEHGYPLTLASVAQGTGIAYHVQFGAPGPWTPSRGKTCPGPARIDQLLNEIIPSLSTPQSEELTVAQNEELKAGQEEILAALYRRTDRIRNDLQVIRAEQRQQYAALAQGVTIGVAEGRTQSKAEEARLERIEKILSRA